MTFIDVHEIVRTEIKDVFGHVLIIDLDFVINTLTDAGYILIFKFN